MLERVFSFLCLFISLRFSALEAKTPSDSTLLTTIKKPIISYSMEVFGWDKFLEEAKSDSIFESLDSSLLSPTKALALSLEYQTFSKEDLDISRYPNLKFLSLNVAPINALPKSIYESKQLIFLSLGNSDSLKVSTSNLLNIKSLEFLYLAGIPLNSIEDVINMNRTLEVLYIDGGNLISLPNSFRNLKTLRTLYIVNNNLERIPASIFDLKELEILNLSLCNITQIDPKNFLKLKHLKRLDLSENQIPEVTLKEIALYVPTNCKIFYH